jgi:hypothetical protein
MLRSGSFVPFTIIGGCSTDEGHANESIGIIYRHESGGIYGRTLNDRHYFSKVSLFRGERDGFYFQ